MLAFDNETALKRKGTEYDSPEIDRIALGWTNNYGSPEWVP
jgi:hypothetical protein